MKLSIIIVHFNTPDFLAACIAAIAGQTGIPEDWEVIVVDNSSNSESILAVSGLVDSYGCTLIRNKKNEGFSRANNIAVHQSSGEHILFLNPDTEAPQESIRYILEYLEQNNDVGIATSKVELPNGGIDDASHRGFPTPWRAFCHFSKLGWLFPTSMLFNGYHLGYKDLNSIHEIDACVGAFMMLPRSVGERVGWFDEDYFWYGEDIDLCFKVKEQGYKVMYIPDVSILHYKGVSSGIKKDSQEMSSASKKTKRLAQKARFNAMRIFYKKHYADTYPPFMYALVMKGIGLLEQVLTKKT